MSHSQHGSTSTGNVQNVPRLLPDLKLALASLYSLPLDQPGVAAAAGAGIECHPSSRQANEYLIHVQSRNIRRRIQSLQQRHRDQQAKNKQPKQNANAAAVVGVDEDPPIHMGSSWLACLALLCQQTGPTNPMIATSTTERLFAAQTLLHRSRRAKLVEAIDLEMEQANDPLESQVLNLYQTNQHVVGLIPAYREWMQGTNAFVAAVVVQKFHQQLSTPPTTTMQDEEQIKGELTLLTLAATVYLTACETQHHQHQQHHDAQIQPILSTLGSAMAATALKLRYTPISIDQQHQQHGSGGGGGGGIGAVPNSQPLVTMLTQALALVWNTAQSLSMVNSVALGVSLHACLSSIPDTLLGSPGGARGRFSIDPRCIQAATQELRTCGLTLLWETLQQQQQQHEQEENGIQSDLWTLTTCERWAKFLPLPLEFMQHSIPLVKKYLSSESPAHHRAAFLYLVAICEGGAWNLDQVLAANLGMVDGQQNQQSGKKKKSSRSKRRQKEAVDTKTTDSSYAQAQVEVKQRADVACQATMLVWDELSAAVQKALAEAHHPSAQVEGEGPIGCLAASANACLSHILLNPSMPHGAELFTALASTFRELCASPNRSVRALSLEPLYTLHATVVELTRNTGTLDSALESVMVEHYVNCAMRLASSCGYPADYFNLLGLDGDEELEIERNDVRDLLRAVAGPSEADASAPPGGMPLKILQRLVRECFEAVSSAQQRNELAPETAIHALSALAKPLNHVAKHFGQNSGQESAEILSVALQTLALVGDMIDEGFRHSNPLQLMPLARVINIATASLAPMFSSLCKSQQGNQVFQEEVHRVIGISVRSSALTVTNLPELASQSTLDHSQYDIRGTMRSPGGEDHVGCLALLRMSTESRELTLAFVKASGPLIEDLCKLHGHLKSIEIERGRGVFHGRGVCPKSRRILLNVLCHIEVVSGGQAGASGMLTSLFNAAIDIVGSFSGVALFDESVLYQICESSFDIAAFSPEIVTSLFKGDDHRSTECVKTLTRAGLQGYQQQAHPQATLAEWNRLRGALFEIVKVSASPDLPALALPMIHALVYAECEAISHQCNAGPVSHSPIFHEDMVSADAVPAGLLVRAITEAIDSASSVDSNTPASVQHCVQSLYSVKDPVLAAIALECPDPDKGAFCDPRPTLCEAWLLAMTRLASLPEAAVPKDLLVESGVVALSMLFYPTMGRTQSDRKSDPGMSLDGPQTLAMLEFLESLFRLGPQLFEALAHELACRVPVDTAAVHELCGDPRVPGMAIVGAALFRATQGALPPWAVEAIPEVYSALFFAVNKDPDRFGLILRVSMETRLHASIGRFGGVDAGQLLSGRFFETMSDNTKATFITDAVDASRKDNGANWRRLKVLVKQACGGKKKETDFNQKPSPTRWEFERI